jgi:high-affinity Fe2+/Pb2+ permease
MEILFITIGGAILGAIARYTLPGRLSSGAVVLPAAGAAISAVVWVVLTWFGLKWDGGWIWVLSLLITGLAVAALALWLPRHRAVADEKRLQELLTTN